QAEHVHGLAGGLHHDQQSLSCRDVRQPLQLDHPRRAGAGRVGGGEDHSAPMMPNEAEVRRFTNALGKPLADLAARSPGESAQRQPVHTVYGGAHLFKSDTAPKLGAVALRALREHAPDAATFASAIGIPAALGATIYPRVVDKLKREAVEDFRIDFEDGYGNRPDEEEDRHAEIAAR